MKVKTTWNMVFEVVYCDVSGDHYISRMKVDAEADTSAEAIFECWAHALAQAISITPPKAALVSIELMDATPYVTTVKGGN